MKSNAQLTQEYFDCMDVLGGDCVGQAQAHRYMEHSTALVHHQVVDCSFVPRLYNDASWDTFTHVVEMTHGILCKVMQRYFDDPTYRELFSFDPRLEELILLPRGYDALLPYARFDVFLDEDTYDVAFCEFNADGSAGSNENREITHSIEISDTYKAFAKTHTVKQCELFMSWVNTFLEIYSTYKYRVETPRFAICDYLDHGVVDEFKVFCEYFAQAGYDCVVADVRDLVFDGETLRTADGQRIDAIWRRCVTNDVMEYWDESQALIDAVRQEKVALIGSFAGHLVHDKQIFDVLVHPSTSVLLTQEEREFISATIPATFFLDSECIDLDDIRKNKDAWIIKPTDAYGADDVYAGCSSSEQQWEELIAKFANGASGAPFLVQRYIKPYRTLTLPPYKSQSVGKLAAEPVLYNNLEGLYAFNGEFMGVFSRLGPLPTISKKHKGMTAASLHIKGSD